MSYAVWKLSAIGVVSALALGSVAHAQSSGDVKLSPTVSALLAAPSADVKKAPYDLGVSLKTPANCTVGQSCAVSVTLDNATAFPAEGPFYVAFTTSAAEGKLEFVSPENWSCEGRENAWVCKSPNQTLSQNISTRWTGKFATSDKAKPVNANVCARIIWMGSDAPQERNARLQVLKSVLKATDTNIDFIDSTVRSGINEGVQKFIAKYALDSVGLNSPKTLATALFGTTALIAQDSSAINDVSCAQVAFQAMVAEVAKPAAAAAAPAKPAPAKAAEVKTPVDMKKPVVTAKVAEMPKVAAPKAAPKVEAPKPAAPKVEAKKPEPVKPAVVAKPVAPKPAKPVVVAKPAAPVAKPVEPSVEVAMLPVYPELKAAQPITGTQYVYYVKAEGEPKTQREVKYITLPYGFGEGGGTQTATPKIIRGNQKPMPLIAQPGVDFNQTFIQGNSPENSYRIINPIPGGVLSNQNALPLNINPNSFSGTAPSRNAPYVIQVPEQK